MEINTKALIKALGGAVPVAKFYGCDRQAIYQWKENIPLVRAYELRDRRPDIYDDIQHGKYE